MEVCERHEEGIKDADSRKPKEVQKSTYRTADVWFSLSGVTVGHVSLQGGVRPGGMGYRTFHGSEMSLKVKQSLRESESEEK